MSTLVWFLGAGTIVAICCWISDDHDLEQLHALFSPRPPAGGAPPSPLAGPPTLTSVPCDPCPYRPTVDLPFGDLEREPLFVVPADGEEADRG